MSKRARALLQTMSAKVSSAIPNNGDLPLHDNPPLKYKVIAKCGTTKARVGVMTLRHGDVDTPVFMPVGTQVRIGAWYSTGKENKTLTHLPGKLFVGYFKGHTS